MPYETKRDLRASALLSSASLSDIVQLQVREKHGQCVGMHLLYSDSTVETLGQWDPIDKTSASTIYDAADGILMRLIYHIRLDRGCLRLPHIEHISAHAATSPWRYEPPEDVEPSSQNIPKSAWEMGCYECSDRYHMQREIVIKCFDCYKPGQVSNLHFQLEFLITLCLLCSIWEASILDVDEAPRRCRSMSRSDHGEDQVRLEARLVSQRTT